MKQRINLLLITATTMLIACSSGNDIFDNNYENTSSNSSSSTGSAGNALEDLATFNIAIDSTTTVTENEIINTDDENYLESGTFAQTINIAYNGNTATVSGSADGVTITTSGADVTVKSSVSGINYVLSGKTTDGSFKIYSDKKFELTLNGVDITNNDGPAINSQSGKRAYILLADGTTNKLTDGTSYATSTEDQKGTIFAEGKLIFSGSGKLCVYANTKAGISADDFVLIHKNTNIYVKSTAGNGIKANDAVTINGGIVNIEVSDNAAKGISSDGVVNINGGRTIAITTGDGEYDSDEKDVSGASGVKADSTFTISGGELLCKSTGKGGKGISGDQKMIFNGGTVKVITTGTTYTYSSYDTKAKGIKADGNIEINDGSIMVRAIGDDGSEGIESKAEITINGGSTEVYSYDDGINSASHMYIKNGYVFSYALGNDGLDANGNMYIQGGTTVAYGTSSPECGIDANEEGGYSVIITGGTLIGIGGGTSYPSSKSTQPSIVYGGSLSSGSTIALNSGSTNIMSLSMGRSYSGTICFLFTSPSMKTGSSYTIYTGSETTGTAWHGLITAATVSSTGTSSASVSSLSSPYSSCGSSIGGMGGGFPGGGR